MRKKWIFLLSIGQYKTKIFCHTLKRPCANVDWLMWRPAGWFYGKRYGQSHFYFFNRVHGLWCALRARRSMEDGVCGCGFARYSGCSSIFPVHFCFGFFLCFSVCVFSFRILYRWVGRKADAAVRATAIAMTMARWQGGNEWRAFGNGLFVFRRWLQLEQQ